MIIKQKVQFQYVKMKKFGQPKAGEAASFKYLTVATGSIDTLVEEPIKYTKDKRLLLSPDCLY